MQPLDDRLRSAAAYCDFLAASLNRHFHLAGFGGLFLRQRDGQDAILIIGLNFLGVHRRRNGKAADEFAVAAFDAVVALDVLVLFEFALAAQGQGLVFDADVDVFDFDVGQVGLQGQGVFGFEDIDGGRPGPVRCAVRSSGG